MTACALITIFHFFCEYKREMAYFFNQKPRIAAARQQNI